eukprot:CAMPEP_0167771680 /NCGR_PEP_ID=MMETSP0111_2-20121227/418_1 /TAXON_ID=91324 /ORGANISM="Lotharella globosa, Strain CCCM811" /LENGTH=254 /DNA_ID=CAMNT_0007661071 /DNA_START=867 /DNA_END=1628 /DNA_ORIENTATION=-
MTAKNKSSALARILLHFTRKGVPWIVMNNWLPNSDIEKYDQVYDLKGCDDSKRLVDGGKTVIIRRNRWYTPPYVWPIFSKEQIDQRRIYKLGKIQAKTTEVHVTPSFKNEFMKTIERDISFLERHSLMDYSLILAMQSSPVDPKGCIFGRLRGFVSMFKTAISQRPSALRMCVSSVYQNKVHTYHFGVIDFLQTWNLKKQVARMIKFREKDKSTEPPQFYATRFMHAMNTLFRGDAKSLSGDIFAFIFRCSVIC